MNSLSRRQLITLAVLFVADVALLAAGFMIVRQPAPSLEATPVVSQASCQALGAERLTEHALAGVTRLDGDGSLRFDLSGQDTSGGELPRPAEAAWDALAAAVTLSQMGCGPYPFVRVDVPDSNGQPGARLMVEVNWVDVRAWGQRELDDGELAARSKATIYFSPQFALP
jgi:hypothetical protein